MCLIVVSLCMVYSNLDTVLSTVMLRKHVYWLLRLVFKLIIVRSFEVLAQPGVLRSTST